jgi:hypothetical protein
MTGTELLEQLLELLEEQVAGVEFRRAWAPGWGSRLLERPVVSGEVASQRRTGASVETVARLNVFGPEASQREETASAVEEAVRTSCPGCEEFSRGEEQVDSVTKLPFLPLKLVFSSGTDVGVQGLTVILGGKSYTVAGATVTVTLSGEELVSVGEDVPFGVRNSQTQYQVELEGIDTTGLEGLAVFTAQVGSKEYTGCRWKKLDLQGGKATFLAAGCEEKEDGQ